MPTAYLTLRIKMTKRILKPPRLQKGDTIGLVSPASPPLAEERVEKAVRYLELLGYRVEVAKHALAQYGYLAGRDEERVADFNTFLQDRTIKAIFAIRGGYGTPRILSLINYKAARLQPKIVVGYSDITALQLALFAKCGLVTFSGPMAGVDMWDSIDPYTEENFWRLLTSAKKIGRLVNPPGEKLAAFGKGTAVGRLLGGNLALVLSNLATPYSPSYNDALLFLEDVDEAPHRIDRMLVQLRNAGITQKINGLLLGQFTDCVPTDPSKPHLTTEQVIDEFSQTVGVPLLANLQFGHIPQKLTIPLGVKARLSTRMRSIEIVESAVI